MRCEQLDLLLEWGEEFRKATSRPSDEKEDQVAFDVVLGDLNFDNCSSGNTLRWCVPCVVCTCVPCLYVMAVSCLVEECMRVPDCTHAFICVFACASLRAFA